MITVGGDEFRTPSKYTLSAEEVVVLRESVLFIGTQFSNLYTAVDTPAKGRVGAFGRAHLQHGQPGGARCFGGCSDGQFC